ncbi:DUF4270 domain-containing protein [Pedobacter sp. WC2423]|uniref:DUF4270 domain-containing protein n=1 Tax=Pedobacter sp. WC2423 TaxID=3234142 RepID=UPI003465F7E3
MKFSKLDLLTLLISLFLFSSCKDSSTIGLDINPATAATGILLDTVTVTSRTELDDPASTYPPATATSAVGLVRYPLGQMTDPIFGSTTANLAMAVTLPGSTGYSFGKAAEIDSAVLVMSYATNTAVPAAVQATIGSQLAQFYGDSTSTFNVRVTQLNSNLSTQNGFLNTTDYASTDLLGSATITPRPNTSVRVVRVIAGAADTAYNAGPQLRIKLSPALIKSKIMALDSVTLSTNANLAAAFKGLKVTASLASGKPGAVMFLNFAGSSSNLEIYYKKQNATTTTLRDTVAAMFPISAPAGPVAATVKHDYTNTAIAAQVKTPADYAVTYLQAMSGVRNKITFPYLKNLKASIGKIVINKAELVIDISDPTDSVPFKIPPRLSLYRLDLAKQRQNLPDNNVASTNNPSGDPRALLPFGGFYDKTKKSYTFVVTSYIQDIVDGKTVDYGTYLVPTATTEFNLQPYATSAGRAVIGSFNNPANRKIRLNIYYVKNPN